MLDKIMRAVKSNNKKRGRNITIGAVIGMLLSCSVVIKADDYLWIKNNSGTIEFSTIDEGGDWKEENPYDENSWNGKTYINNMTLFGTDNGKDVYNNIIGYGLRLNGDLKKVEFINNSSISGGGNWGYGIYNDSGIISSIKNNGTISGSGSGIYNYSYKSGSSVIENLTNNGSISGSASGIYNYSEDSGSSSIGKLINNGTISGSASGIYNESSRSGSNSRIGSLINNGTIYGNYGIYNYSSNSGLKSSIGSLINIGNIVGSVSGIYNQSSKSDSSIIENLTNNGSISGSASGIYNHSRDSDSSIIESLINNGTIYGSDFGIFNYSLKSGSKSNIENLQNTGTISGSAFGIYNESDISGSSTIESLVNSGTIYGANTGIYNYSSDSGSSTIKSLINTGVIFGKTNAINNKGGTINNAYNYGLLVSSTSSVVENINSGIIGKGDKYGLAFKVDGEKYTLDEDYSGEFGEVYSPKEGIVIGYEKDAKGKFDFDKPITEKYTIVNAKAERDSSNDVTGTKSLVLKNGILFHDDSEASEIKDYSSDKKYILNGITDTLKVFGMHNKLNNSVVNAYKTAVVMNENKSMITLDNTVVNGGMKADTDSETISTVNITGNENNFTVKGDSVINTKDKGVAIIVTGNNNAITLEGEAIVNGKMESTGADNILALNGTAEYGMDILHDITGFTNMNIDNNVTFFENVKVTGTDTVTVEGTGVLNLRLKKDTALSALSGDITSKPPKAIHAFSGRDEKHEMTIKGSSLDEAGTLNFITNGIGREILVDMENITLENMKIKASSIIDTAKIEGDYIHLGAGSDLGGIVNRKEVKRYNQLNSIYRSIYSSTDEKNLDELRDILNITYIGKNYDYNNITDEEQLVNLLGYLNSIYTESPYSYSSELSRKSTGMFRDIVTENEFRPNLNNWLIMGGLTHTDGGTKDTYYGQNYYEIDNGSSSTNADMKLTGAYMLAKYGYSENLSLGLTLGGNKSEAKLSMSKVKGNSGYLGAFAENYRGNLTLKAGAGVQYSEYDADRSTLGGHSYSDKYSDMTYDIYLNGRYSHQVGDNLFLEPYATLSYTYTDQDGANEGSKALAIETDSKSFDYTVGKVGVDLKKIIPHEKGKSTLTAGVSYTKILDGAEEEYITGRFKGGSDFDILVAHKNEHSIGLNAKYALELENGILFDVKGTYSVERDSHNGSGKNKAKGEWIAGAGMGYKF